MKKIAHGILAEARQTRQNYQATGSDFDRVQANMYSIFECYAHGLIDWEQVKTRFKTSIREYVSLYKGTEHLKEEIEFMRQEYKNVLRNYKPALDAYRVVSEQKLAAKLVAKKNLSESVAQQHSSTYYNSRTLTESDLSDTTGLSWKRVMEAYPNLTTKDQARIRMLTIFEGPTLDTTQMITTVMDDIEFNPRAGHLDSPMHPQNRGLTNPRNSSPRPKLRPKNFAQIKQRADINKAVQSAMGEGWEELPPMPDRYQERDGLEGPIMTRSGKVVYYDPKAGNYYDPDTDMYISYDDFRMLDKKGMYKVDEARSKQLHDIQWPDTDEDGDSEMATHAYNAIRHNFPAYDAYGHVYSMTRHRDWLEANKEELIKMFAGYGLPMDYDESVHEASTVNGVNMDGKKRWKQTSMSPEEATSKYGKENVRVKKGALRNGDDMVEVYVEGHSPHKKGTEKYRKHMAAMHAEADEKNVKGFDTKTIKALADLKVDYPHAPDTLSAILRALEDVKSASKREDRTHSGEIDKLEKRVDDLEKDHASMTNEDMSDDEIDAFHRALDELVHKHLGHGSHEKDEMNEWGGDDQYEASERAIENALSIFDQMLDNGEDELRARAEAHDYLKGELGDLGVRHGDLESKQYHGELEKEIIQIMNQRDKGMRESEDNPYASQDIMHEDPPLGIDYDFGNLPKVDWSRYSKKDIEKFVDHLESLDFEDGFQLDGEYHGMYRTAANWVEKNVLSKMEGRAPDHNMQARMRLNKIMRQAIKDSKKKRGIEDEDEKDRTDEMTSAGAVASVAQPMGKMQRRNKVKEDQMMTEAEFDEAAGEKDACYHKVKSRYKVWPSAYASGALVKCRKVGAKNWGKSKK